MDLIKNINKLHTTYLGILRIKNNLKLKDIDVVDWCKKIILDNKSNIYLKGRNWYIENDIYILTVNKNSYTIITGHLRK